MQPESISIARQDRVAKALQDRSTRLAGLYRSALNALYSRPEADCEVARIAVICHCMRELMLNLPTVMADSIEERPDPSSGALTAKLPSLLANHPEVDLSIDQDIVPVPKDVAKAFAALIAAKTQEEGRNQRNAAALLTGGSDPKHPVLKQWKTAYDFFVGWAHLDRNHERGGDLPSDNDIIDAMWVFEDVVEVRSAVFFENLHSIEGLLKQINAQIEDHQL